MSVENFLEDQETICVLQAAQSAETDRLQIIISPIYFLACFEGIEGLNNTQNTFEADLERCSNTGLERQKARRSVYVVP